MLRRDTLLEVDEKAIEAMCIVANYVEVALTLIVREVKRFWTGWRGARVVVLGCCTYTVECQHALQRLCDRGMYAICSAGILQRRTSEMFRSRIEGLIWIRLPLFAVALKHCRRYTSRHDLTGHQKDLKCSIGVGGKFRCLHRPNMFCDILQQMDCAE